MSLAHLATGIALLCGATISASAAGPTAAQVEYFETQVRPLLAHNCHKCHGEKKQQGHLRLDSRSAMLKGGDTGPAITPGRPEESELIRAVSYDPDGYQMPPDGKLSDEQIETLTRWVRMGAPWPDDAGATAAAEAEFNLEERAKRWSFQPLTKPPVPPLSTPAAPGIRDPRADWCRNPIDRFILARLIENGLAPSEPAERRTLLRRASFDLLGLPPSPEQVAAFERDESPDACERMIDELLASPHFGERWGRHWLDLVRYAESRGHEFDVDVANGWQYRDYVIRALNDDVPYDQLVVEHVAGDLLEPFDPELACNSDEQQNANREFCARLHPLSGANASIVATGFWFLGEWVHSPVDIRQDEADRFANMIDVYSKTFLGLTVACARCHDHKFDPITTKDFYALQGYLQSSHYQQARFETMEHNRRIAAELEQLRREAAEAILPVYMRLIESSAKRLDGTLLAARRVFQLHPEILLTPQEEPSTNVLREAAREAVAGSDLESEDVAAWVRHLWTVARTDESDPFHLWAGLCCGEIPELGDLRAVLDAASEQAEPSSAASSAEDPQQFHSHDVSGITSADNGIRVRPQAPLLSDDPERPYTHFDEWITAESDPLFDRLDVAAETQPEPGATGEQREDGRTLRTETFPIDLPFLALRVRGGCSTYLAVDSHVLIKGPLHGSLFQLHAAPEGNNREWRWITLDVSRYKGHRAHLEMTALPGAGFAVDDIRTTDSPPTESTSIADRVFLCPQSPHAEFRSIEDVGAALRQRFDGAASDIYDAYLFHGGFPGPALCLDKAQWVIDHPELFGLSQLAARQQLQAAARPFIEKQRELVSGIRSVSATAPAMVQGSEEFENIFVRGNWKKPGELVPRGFLEVFDGGWVPRDNTGHGDRLPLAEWMVDPDKTPILPRVIVNRIWQHYFGQGIVPTPDDFGYMGQEPSHPELLEWLACELVENDWSLKHIHRLILTSAAYQMASKGDPEEVDPDNRLLHCQNVKRLEGEAIRDAILTLSGRLDGRLYGPSVPVHLTEFLEGRGRPEVSGPVDGAGRRSLYVAVRRNFPEPFFQAFDFPNPHTTVGRRNVSNVPAQALAMLNNPLVVQQAQRWGERTVAGHAAADADARIRRLYMEAFSREPTAEEVSRGREFLTTQVTDSGMDFDDPRVWADYCHTLLNTKEFLYVR